jgi:pilus assembly protein CpaC
VNANNRSAIASFATLLLSLGSLPAVHGQARASRPNYNGAVVQDTANDLFVAVGKSVLVDSDHPIQRVSVGSSELAEATAVSPSEVLVNGKAPGETSLIVWQEGGGRLFFNLKVGASAYVANDRMEAVRRQLRAELPGQELKVSAENGLVFLRGNVKDLSASNRAVQIAATAGKVINLLYVDVPTQPRQILLKVKFASVDRSKEMQLGLNLFSLNNKGVGSVGTGQFSPASVTLPTATSAAAATLASGLQLSIFRPDINLGAQLEALQTDGLVQLLAEPNVIAQDGKEASFLAGGEYPYPVVQGATGGGVGAVTIQFKEYGIRLNFIPTITPRGTIRLQVAPEVSTLDFTNAIEISGFDVPAIDIRRVRTEVEIGAGQSFVLGGLIDNTETKTFEKIPFIGDVPILGKLFQSIQKTRTNTELIVIVTPEFVDPIPVGAPVPSLKYPDKFLSATSGIPMSNPETAAGGTPQPPTMPVEQLIQSMQPEQPLVIDTTMQVSGGSQQQAPAAAPVNPTPVLTTAPQQ